MSSRRMLRDCTDSDKVNILSANAEVLFYRLMMKADDYGSFHANPKLIKAFCFPLRLETVREADITRWTDELQKAGVIVIYTDAGKSYLRILNFGQRLRNKRNVFPQCPDHLLSADDRPRPAASGGELRPEVELEEEVEDEEETEVKVSKAKALPAGKPALQKFDSEDKKLRKEWERLVLPDVSREAWSVIKNWITEMKPQFIEPYVAAWNVFASVYNLPAVKVINDSRRRKFNVRIKEAAFDFMAILAIVKNSDFLKTGSWFGFDWLLENDQNYLKVLEGTYK